MGGQQTTSFEEYAKTQDEVVKEEAASPVPIMQELPVEEVEDQAVS